MKYAMLLSAAAAILLAVGCSEKTAESVQSLLQKAAAIDIDEARIIVVWSKVSNNPDTAAANRQLCAEHQQKAAVFSGKDLLLWDNVLSGWRAFSDFNEIVYTGKLERKDTTGT